MIDNLDTALARKFGPASRRRPSYRGDTTQTFVRLAEQDAPGFGVANEAVQRGRLQRLLQTVLRLARRGMART